MMYISPLLKTNTINHHHTFYSDTYLPLPKLVSPKPHRMIKFPTNKKDDSAVALPLIHSIDLVRSWWQAKPEIFYLSWIKGH